MNLNKILVKATAELLACNIITAEIDVRILLREALNKDDVYLISHSEELITNSQYQRFRRYIRRRKKGEPIAYITGHKEFYGLDFFVDKNVLIPRPETEVLVETALHFLELRIKNKELSETDCLNIIDIGTGSGCIIISLVKNLSPVTSHLSPFFYASDTSTKALNIAKKNAKYHEIYDNIRFFKSDLFSNKKIPKKFDIIIANLPYLDSFKLREKDHKSATIGINFEPDEALYAKNKGFEIIKRLISQLPSKLNKNSIALIEADPSQTEKISSECVNNQLVFKQISTTGKFNGFFAITRK